MNKEDYNGYKAKGGTLVQEYYELAIEFSENGWKLLSEEADIFSCTSILASFSQARHMAHYAEIELTEVEKLMYVFLRIRPLEENIEDTRKDGGFRPQGLNDQVLMAEIFLITNPDKREKFVRRWENIFQV
jgi:hypothetical protein